MEKKTQRDSDRINPFQQKKLAEQLAIGMAVRNADGMAVRVAILQPRTQTSS